MGYRCQAEAQHNWPRRWLARSTSRRIGYEGNVCNWKVERDLGLQDLCIRPCSNFTGYSDFSIRAGNLLQPQYFLPDSNDSNADDERIDGERFQFRRGIENQIRECVHDYGDPQAAVSPDPWASGPKTLIPTEGHLTSDVSGCRIQKKPTPSSTNQLQSNSPDSFERRKSLRSSPSITSGQRTVPHAESEVEVGASLARRLRTGEASDHTNKAPPLKNLSQLAERGSAPPNFVVEDLDESESTRSSGGGSLEERSSSWTENVELVRSSPILFPDNIVEYIGVGERDAFHFHDVIDSLATHGEGQEPAAESGNSRGQNHNHNELHPQRRQQKPKTANTIHDNPQLQGLAELTSRGATQDAVIIESLPQSSACDRPLQRSYLPRIDRRRRIQRTSGECERHVGEIATKSRRSRERVDNPGGSTRSTAGHQANPERTGDISTGRKFQDTVVETAGLHAIPERIGGTAQSLNVEVSESRSACGTADSYPAQEGIGGSAESFTIRERTGGSPAEGNKIPERIGAGSERDSAGKVPEKGKEEKLHSREEGYQRQSDSQEERRLRARVDGSIGGASGGAEEAEEPKVLRPARPSGGKDRHSKVNTAKGPRDRRVRLSVPTAVQFYDVQDRLGFDQPSKAVEWLIHKAKDAIDELGRIPVDGNEVPRVQAGCGSDISHHGPPPSSYNAAVSGLMGGSSSCSSSSFQASSTNPYGDQISFFMDPSITPGMFASLEPSESNFAGPTFGLGRIDLTRGNSGSIEVGRSSESTGSPLKRQESRTKARERARERTKKGPGGDGNQGNVTGGGSPSSSHSPPFHSNPVFSSFNASNSMQGSVHSLSLQSAHQSPLLSGVYESTLFPKLIQGSHQAGAFQNLIMQNPTLDSQFNDHIQSPLQNAFLVQPQATLQSSHTINLLQQPQLQLMRGNAQPALHLGSTFNPGPSSSSFPEASMSSSQYPSVSTLPLSQSLSVPQLSVLGMSPASSLGPHYLTGSPTPIPPGFSPGPPASAFRAHSLSISQCSNRNQQQQQQLQGVPRVQRTVPSFSNALSLSTSQASTQCYYLGTSSNTVMGCLQSIPSERLNSPSFAPRSNMGYEHGQRPLSMMSPRMNPFQVSNSQIPARIQGTTDDMEEVEEELNPATPSSPHRSPHP